MASEPLTTLSLDRDTAADLKQFKLELERAERRSLTMGQAVARLIAQFTQQARPGC